MGRYMGEKVCVLPPPPLQVDTKEKNDEEGPG